MKVVKKIFILVLINSFVWAGNPTINNWLFNIGDDSSWASIEINDSNWYSINVPGSWESQGFANYDGIAWYRSEFSIDSGSVWNDTLFLCLGKVGNRAHPFVNGVSLTEAAQDTDTNSDLKCFVIPHVLLKSDNTLAIRVDNQTGDGGLLSGPITILMTPPQIKTPEKRQVAHRSWYMLPFGNGVSSAFYDVQRRSFSNFTPHLYKPSDGTEQTEIVAVSGRTILFNKRREIDLSTMETLSSGYINGTGIVHHQLHNKNCTFDQFAFSPFSSNHAFWVFYAMVTSDSVENYSLNFEFEGLAPGMNIGKWSFRENNRKWLFVVCSYTKTPDQKSYTAIQKFKNENPGFSALVNEIEWWKKWQKNTVLPQDIPKTERSVYLQSLALLKMAQSRERFPTRGLIVQTFPPDDLAVASVPGICFAIDAFLKSGHFEEALDALQFVMNGNSGALKHYNWSGENRGLGRNYAVSVNYYHGNGSEATDTGEYGPVIYLGNFGLLLWNLRQYIEATNDYRFLEYYWPKISSEIADVIIANIDDTGLLRADNGFFNPGAQKHYFYTSACGYRGLIDAVWLARMVNDENRARQYETAAISLRQAIEEHFIAESGFVKSFIEDGENNLDAAIAIGLAWVFTPQDNSSKSTVDTFTKKLSRDNGFARFETIAPMEKNEWVLGNLMISRLLDYMTSFENADRLRTWVGKQAFHNYGLIPEYYSAGNSDYTGTVPMCGLGAGAYISIFWGE
ncbi:MAG: hypothetical protein DRP96_10075 [Candidatus Neomarinimicrobiota bacterium]|nr:MAG: hypothetical protein DRP96_10075 [Candidatus Neomarinimicrobiota bacterium]